MNYAPTALKSIWYQTLNHANVPVIESINAIPATKSTFQCFERSIVPIGDMLKFGLSKGYISQERINEVINIDPTSHAGMTVVADVITNDFWVGFSSEINRIRQTIEKRYVEEMPTALKDSFLELANRNASFHEISIGRNPDAYNSPDRFHVSITASELYLSNFEFAKYQFNPKVKEALFTLVNHTMRHQFEAPAAMNDNTHWMMEELFEDDESIPAMIHHYWKNNNEDYHLDVEEMMNELELSTYAEQVEDTGLETIILHVEATLLENKIIDSFSEESLEKCFSCLAFAGKSDENIKYLHNMAQYLPKELLHHATDEVGDVGMDSQALYSFGSRSEYQMADSTFEHSYQTAEQSDLELEASELGLSFLQNYFETLYLKSLIQAVLE